MDPMLFYEPELSNRPSLSSQTVRSSVFLIAARAVRLSIVFAVQLILMNLLAPSDFGLIRLATVVTGVIDLVNEIGLSYALIQKKNIIETQLASAFSLNALISAALCMIAFFCAPFCANFFGTPEAAVFIRVGAFGSFSGALSTVHRSVLQRRFQYDRLAIIEVAGTFAGAVAAILLAAGGYGVWALLGGPFVFNIVSSCVLMATTPWPRGNYLNLFPARIFLFFTGWVVFQRIINYCMQNFIYIVIGKSFGKEVLGIYGIAVTLITLPQLAFGIIVDSVFLAAFSRLQDDDRRLGAAFLKANSFASIVSVPYIVLLFSFAKEILHAISFVDRGNAWVPAAILVKILALLGLFFVFSCFTSTIWLAKGKVKLRLYWEAVGFLVIIAAVLVGRPFGINGICIALSIGGCSLFPAYLIITGRLIVLRPSVFMKVIFPSVVCGAGMLTFTWLFSKLVPGDSFTRDVLTLLAGSAGGLAVYSFLLIVFFKDAKQNLIEIFSLIKGVKYRISRQTY